MGSLQLLDLTANRLKALDDRVLSLQGKGIYLGRARNVIHGVSYSLRSRPGKALQDLNIYYSGKIFLMTCCPSCIWLVLQVNLLDQQPKRLFVPASYLLAAATQAW